MNTPDERFGRPQRWMHWGMALTLPAQGLLGWFAERTDDQALGDLLMAAHLQLGLALLLAVIARLSLRLHRPPPPLATPDPPWQRHSAAAVQAALYALMVLLPLSGLVLWAWMQTPLEVFGLLQVPTPFSARPEDETALVVAWYLHVWGAWTLLGLATLHIGAALWHQWVRRDGRISRRL